MMAATLSPLSETGLEAARDRRKSHIRNREWWLAVQKSCGKDQRDIARFASDQAKEHLQWEKAATWVISFTEGTAPAYAQGGLYSDSWTLQQMPCELSDKILQEHSCADYGIPVPPSVGDKCWAHCRGDVTPVTIERIYFRGWPILASIEPAELMYTVYMYDLEKLNDQGLVYPRLGHELYKTEELACAAAEKYVRDNREWVESQPWYGPEHQEARERLQASVESQQSVGDE